MNMKNINLAILACFCAVGLVAQSVIITEIQYNPATAGQGGTEYLELYNNGSVNVDLTNWVVSGTGANSMNYTFGSYTLGAGQYVVLTNNPTNLLSFYSVTGLQYTGFLLNTGMAITVKDAGGVTMDSLTYAPSAPWPTIAAAGGPSIELCDYNSDNTDPANWRRSITRVGNNNTRDIYGTPGAMNACPSAPVIQFRFNGAALEESAGTRKYGVYIDNPASTATTVQIGAMNISGTLGADVTFTSPQTITFPANFQGMDTSFSFTIIDDTLYEPEEQVLFYLMNPNNGAQLLTDSFMLLINEDFQDRPVDRDMVLIGITDDEAGGSPRMIEVFVRKDIPELSIYGLGSANNGGGSDGVEFTFPSGPVNKGENFFVTNDSARFVAFFGFPADFIDIAGLNGPTSFNGNDAIELFENGRVIDRYGWHNEDGTGKVWEYTDGWAKRKPKTGPDGNLFVSANWEFSGKDVFDGIAKNADAVKPYPINTYYYDDPEDTSTISTPEFLQHQAVRIYPNPASDILYISSDRVINQVSVYNILGSEVLSYYSGNNSMALDVAELQSGNYILRMEMANGNKMYRRFVCD
jgi:hypothetical protein